jgi:cysteine synthase
MIDLTIHEDRLERTVQRARERNIIIPTFKQMRHPELIPDKIKRQLDDVGLWDLNPLNLFRITWHNQPVDQGGEFGGVNYLVLPPELTGVQGPHRPAGGQVVPHRRAQGRRGLRLPGAAAGHRPVRPHHAEGRLALHRQLLPRRRLRLQPAGLRVHRHPARRDEPGALRLAGQIVAEETIKTPGSESNVKEIFDKCWELRRSGQDLMIFNQFEEFGNYLWHYEVTGPAIEEVLSRDGAQRPLPRRGPDHRLGRHHRLRRLPEEAVPTSKIVASEALQCPTLLLNGFGAHRIEGIGDKHVPWIHNVKNTDMVVAIDDAATMALMRLFNEPAGSEYLVQAGRAQRNWSASCRCWASPASPTCCRPSSSPSTTS